MITYASYKSCSTKYLSELVNMLSINVADVSVILVVFKTVEIIQLELIRSKKSWSFNVILDLY